MPLSSKHRKTLADVFATPTRSGIKWSRIEALVLALGGTVDQRSGSRVALALGGFEAVFHTPHPSPDTRRAAVRAVADLLSIAGFSPKIGPPDPSVS